MIITSCDGGYHLKWEEGTRIGVFTRQAIVTNFPDLVSKLKEVFGEKKCEIYVKAGKWGKDG